MSITSPDGIVTSFAVDADNNLRQVTYPDGTYYAMDYLPGGLMSDEYHPDGSLVTHVFDPYGRLTDALDPEGGHWNYDRRADASGNVNVSVLTGEGDSTTYVDQTRSTGEFSSVITGPDGSQTAFIQSADGLSARKQATCGTDLTFNYGLDSEFSYQKLKSSTTTMPSSLSVATSTPGLLDTDFVYDLRGRLTNVSVGTRTTSFAYDPNGYLDLMTTPDNRTFDRVHGVRVFW